MAWLAVLLLLPGPAETIAGKFPVHGAEYERLYPREAVPMPEPLPGGVDELCRLVEAGHATAEVFAALGDALLARGDGALAYRAFHRAQSARPEDAAWRARMQERKERSTYVSPRRIEAEERQARYWVERLQEYERSRIARGEDPRDLAPFYELYGRPEEDLGDIARVRRTRWLARASAGLLVLAAILGGVLYLRRRRA